MLWNMKIVGPGTRYGYSTSGVPSRVMTVEDASKIVHAWFPNSWALICDAGTLLTLEVRVNVHKVTDWRRKMRALRRELRRKIPVAAELIVRPGRHHAGWHGKKYSSNQLRIRRRDVAIVRPA